MAIIQIFFYGAVKAVKVTKMILEHGELKTSFFSEVATDIPKLAISSAVAAAASGAVVAAGAPVAVAVGYLLQLGQI